MITPITGFCSFLALTVLLLAGVVITGVKARVVLHVPLVVCTVAALATTIYFAEKLGALFDLAGAGMITPIHLALAKTATASYLLPLATGIATLRDRKHRRIHFWCAIATLALTLATAVTGTWMICIAPWKG